MGGFGKATQLCISFKLFIDILTKQPVSDTAIIVNVLCISFKLFIDILTKQPCKVCRKK